MFSFIDGLVFSKQYIPYGHCYLWQPGLLWLHLLSDVLITLAYFSILLTLVYFVSLNLKLESRVEQRTRENQENEQRFSSLFEAAPDFIYLLNLKGKIEQVNPAVIQQSGYAESELIEQRLVDFLSPVSQQLFDLEFADLLRQGKSRHEMEFVCKDTTVLTMDCSCTLVGDRQQDDTYILVLQRDISDRKKIEETLRQTNQELLASNEELEKFAYLADHDLREPLRMVTSFTQLLSQRYSGKLDADADQIIGFAVDGASRMEELINDLLEYSRVGKAEQLWKLVDCEAIVDQALINLQVSIRETNVHITRRPLPSVMGDSGQLIQLWQILLDNAIIYRHQESPEIEIGVEVKPEAWLFWVKDNGIGIAPQYQERIFQIFQRLHTKEEYPGTGIGLAICHKIVERHQGQIWVESAPGAGATFYFTLPQAKNL